MIVNNSKRGQTPFAGRRDKLDRDNKKKCKKAANNSYSDNFNNNSSIMHQKTNDENTL